MIVPDKQRYSGIHNSHVVMSELQNNTMPYNALHSPSSTHNAANGQHVHWQSSTRFTQRSTPHMSGRTHDMCERNSAQVSTQMPVLQKLHCTEQDDPKLHCRQLRCRPWIWTSTSPTRLPSWHNMLMPTIYWHIYATAQKPQPAHISIH